MHFASHVRQPHVEKLQMSAMIDVVFLLLVFFVMTFRIVKAEGEFNVQMPKGGSGPPVIFQSLPLHIHLAAGPSGQLLGPRMELLVDFF